MAKTILITGASSGIGAGMAREFAKKGYNLAICARRLERLETLKQELESRYDIKVIAKTLDVTNYDQV
ncbi:MAG TPA: short chain dehydrogenase, partial [Acinetobacter sp.]|nr:short chain dehydrogenase [Acinetobacter sp.]